LLIFKALSSAQRWASSFWLVFLVCSPFGWEEMEKQIKAKLEKIESLMENLLATFVSTSEKPLDLG